MLNLLRLHVGDALFVFEIERDVLPEKQEKIRDAGQNENLELPGAAYDHKTQQDPHNPTQPSNLDR